MASKLPIGLFTGADLRASISQLVDELDARTARLATVEALATSLSDNAQSMQTAMASMQITIASLQAGTGGSTGGGTGGGVTDPGTGTGGSTGGSTGGTGSTFNPGSAAVLDLAGVFGPLPTQASALTLSSTGILGGL